MASGEGLFLNMDEAEKVVRLVSSRSWVCFDEMESALAGEFREKAPFILMALRNFFAEEEKEDPEIDRAWKEFTGGEPVKISNLEKMVKEFCTTHGYDEKRFWRWWNSRPRLITIRRPTPKDLMAVANYYILKHIPVSYTHLTLPTTERV